MEAMIIKIMTLVMITTAADNDERTMIGCFKEIIIYIMVHINCEVLRKNSLIG